MSPSSGSSPRLLVLGGSGLIGREVCRLAIERGSRVISVSRSGRPAVFLPAWADQVTWVAADVFEPARWRKHLAGCTAVVHCIGVERARAGSSATYERLHHESAAVAAAEAERAGVLSFVYLSAGGDVPGAGEDYVLSKRRGEAALRQRSFHTVVLRPRIVYGSQQPPSVLLGWAAKLVRRLPGAQGPLAEGEPLEAEVVARAAVRAALAPEISGVLEVEDIERLGRVTPGA